MDEKIQRSISIDSAAGFVPFVGFHIFTFVAIFFGLYIGYTLRDRDLLLGLTATLFYIIMMVSIRMSESKLYKKVPEFKGWVQHKQDVAQVHNEFKEFLKNRLPNEKASINRFKRGSHETHRTVETKYKENAFKINIGHMDSIIEIDKDKMLLHAQPGIPMDELASQAIAHKVVPQIVPEFPGITVGGAIGGVAGESTGHKYGLFHNTVQSMDVITGDGELHKDVSRTNKPDLFHAMCGSYGTQGILVRASIRLMDAPLAVRTEYYHMNSMKEALLKMEDLSTQEEGPEFLDGVALSPSSIMIVAGYPSNNTGPQLSLRGKRTDPWFFWYLTDLARTHSTNARPIHIDYLSLDDYLFRFDRGAFWAARHGMMFFCGKGSYNPSPEAAAGPHPLLRILWSWVFSTRQMYKICHAPGDAHLAESYILQDFILPTKEATVALHEFNTEKEYHMWPLWICPIRKVEDNVELDTGFGLPLEGKKGNLMFNLGFYGPVNYGKPMNPIQKNRELEQKVFEQKGKKWLYAQSFYTEDEFWAHYNKANYTVLREKYHNDVFHPILQKVLLSDKTKTNICKECPVNIWSYLPKLIPPIALGYVELLTPRIVHPFLGIEHTQTIVYTK